MQNADNSFAQTDIGWKEAEGEGFCYWMCILLCCFSLGSTLVTITIVQGYDTAIKSSEIWEAEAKGFLRIQD